MSKLISSLLHGMGGRGRNASGAGTGTADEVSRSQYSLVSSQDLTPEAMRLWLTLPEEVKYDSTLNIFRQQFEKDQSPDKEVKFKQNESLKQKRIHLVASAPNLDENLHVHQTPGEDNSKEYQNFIDFGIKKFCNRQGVDKDPQAQNEDIEERRVISEECSVDIVNDCRKGEDGSTLKSGLSSEVHMSKTLPKRSRVAKAKYITKISILVGVWIFFTVVFMTCGVQIDSVMQTYVQPGEVKEYIINSQDPGLTVLAKLTGPFATEHIEAKYNDSAFESAPNFKIWLEKLSIVPRTGGDNINITTDDIIMREVSQIKRMLLNENDIDFSQGILRTQHLIISSGSHYDNGSRSNTDEYHFDKFHYDNDSFLYVVKIETNGNKTVPLTLSFAENPLDKTTGLILALFLLCALYFLIIFEVINRTMAAVVVCTLAVGVVSLGGQRPSLPELISWLDAETLLLLFSMMLLVAIMAETGMFDALAVFTFEKTKGKMWPLLNSLCIITALMSLVLDNVTTVLLMTPVTIRLCEVMELDPVPILISMVLFCNVGGTATPVGDPPNVIMASNKDVVAAGIHFTNFTLHMSLGIILVGIQTYFQLRYIYRDTNKLRLKEPKEIQELRRQIGIWRRAADSLPQLSADQAVVRERLERKVCKLQAQLRVQLRESTKRACPKDTFQATLTEMKRKYKIRDKALLLKASIALAFVVVIFFLHSIPGPNRVSPGWTALLGAILLLILADKEDLEPILHRVEWSTLIFFAALFVFIEALSKLGLIDYIGGLTQSLILQVDEGSRLAVAILILVWVSGITSAFVDNVPLTTMMVRIVTSLGTNPTLGLPMAPLVWALSFGVCLGGNGTLIGASANVVCAGVAEQHGYRISFMQFTKIGFPLMLGHLVVASAYLLVAHCVFNWH